MGGCIGITRSRSGPIEESSGTVSRPNSGALRKNQSLCHETIRWKSDVPLTEGQLRSKRDEFWDTAPAFEGRKEIWDALRAAAVAAEAMDFQLAQAILDGASVSVPNGYLTECYDEWGTRYQTPEICLGYIETDVIVTLVAAQSVYAFLNFVLSYLMNWRRIVLLFILCISTLSGVSLGWMPEPVSSVFLFMVFSCTNLGMGILASYFVDLYPTSCRGMVQCLSIMVGRSCTFIGINIVGSLIFNRCHTTFYVWSLLVFSSVVAAWFLPKDKPISK